MLRPKLEKYDELWLRFADRSKLKFMIAKFSL